MSPSELVVNKGQILEHRNWVRQIRIRTRASMNPRLYEPSLECVFAVFYSFAEEYA